MFANITAIGISRHLIHVHIYHKTASLFGKRDKELDSFVNVCVHFLSQNMIKQHKQNSF